MATENLTDSFGGGWGSFVEGVADTFESALNVGIQYELYQQTKDNQGAGQAQLVNAVTVDSQANANPELISQTNGGQAIKGIDNKMLIGGSVVAIIITLLVIKVK